MSLFNDPDDVVDALRAPATTAELADESSAVELMAHAHLTAVQPSARRTSMSSRSRRTRVATLIAAGVIGFGGVAAASPGGLDILSVGSDEAGMTDEVADVTTTVSTTIVEEVTTTTTANDPDDNVETQQRVEDESSKQDDAKGEQFVVGVVELPSDGQDTLEFTEDDCATDDEGNELNHGKTVSAVARGDEGFENFEVRDAAHSDCGKVDRNTAGTDVDGEIEETKTEQSEIEESKPEKPKPENSKADRATSKDAKANAQGKSNGNGKKSND